jgi:uncharacterized cupredoxin-like copper-binding protein
MNRSATGLFGSALLALTLVSPAVLAAEDEEQVLKQHPALANVKWDAAKEIVVDLDDDNYEPSEIVLKRDLPYRLRLKNIGVKAHDMVGGSFFEEKAIALKMINTRVGRVTADRINSVYIKSKNEAEIWFVALKTGHFSFYCSIPGHREAGMGGVVKIVD